jgi:pimeloyl-ACP methyl ester carboxylesterase
LWIDAPERIASLVLLAPVPACGAQLSAERRTLLRGAVADPAARRDLIDVNTGRRCPADWIDRVLALSLRTTREDAMLAYLESWSDTDFAPEVKSAPVPVHVILGELDPGASIERMRQTVLHWYAGATCEVMRAVGHYPMHERPDELHTLVSRWLGGAAGANESAIS